MSFLTNMLAASNPSSFDAALQAAGFDLAPATVAGVSVGPESALKLSAVYACDRLISETVASLPALVFERLADGGRKRATNHPLYDVLHRAPNEHQTPIEFFDFLTHCALMRGNGFARIVPGRRGFADQLIPLHPDYVEMRADGRGGLSYRVTVPGQAPLLLADEDVLHVKGMSADGMTGVSVVSYARDSFGLALGAERYGGRFFRNNARPGGVLESAKLLSPEAAKRVKASWEIAHAGDNQHRVAVLEDGLTFKEVGINHKDSQFLETREFQAEDVCRWFRVPPHMVGLTSKATSWGSGIEQMSQGFITYTLMPWLVRWQQAITRDLILAPDKYFVEFVTEALLRGDLKGRYDAYAVALEHSWLSPNEVRQFENLNPYAGGDVYAPIGAGTLQMQAAPIAAPVAVAGEHYAHLAHLAAARVVRKEVAALSKAAKRGGDWAAAVSEFYAAHAEFVVQALGVTVATAAAYVAGAVEAVTDAGPEGVTGAEAARADELAALVLAAGGVEAQASSAPTINVHVAAPPPAQFSAPITVNVPPVAPVQVQTPIVNQVNVPPAPEQTAPVVNVTNQVNPTPVSVLNRVDVQAAEAPQVVVNTPRLSRQRTVVKRKGEEMTGTDSTFEYED